MPDVPQTSSSPQRSALTRAKEAWKSADEFVWEWTQLPLAMWVWAIVLMTVLGPFLRGV